MKVIMKKNKFLIVLLIIGLAQTGFTPCLNATYTDSEHARDIYINATAILASMISMGVTSHILVRCGFGLEERHVGRAFAGLVLIAAIGYASLYGTQYILASLTRQAKDKDRVY